jgi:hypothetical protein
VFKPRRVAGVAVRGPREEGPREKGLLRSCHDSTTWPCFRFPRKAKARQLFRFRVFAEASRKAVTSDRLKRCGEPVWAESQAPIC